MIKNPIYFLAGLCFDERIFYNLELNDVQVNYLKWLEPEQNESLDEYVNRIAEQIEPSKFPPILIGHSFGGIIVQLLSKKITIEKVIIISSIKSEAEKPITLKILKYIKLYVIINKRLILSTFPLWARSFGYNSKKSRNLFIQMISDCSDNYLRWSFEKIVQFRGSLDIQNLYHIHGTNDKTFPINKIKNPIQIKDGSHFMVFSKAEEISKQLNKIIHKSQ